MTFRADYPGALVVEARNYGYLTANRPSGWVLHTPEEPADEHMSTPYYFATTDRRASTHYFVSWLGFVVQCVPEIQGPYANGVVGKPYPVWASPGENLNLQSLSVEIEGYAASIAQTLSAAQRRALVDLLAYGCRKYDIPADRTHIIGHYEVANNRSDPGTLNIQAIVDMVKAKLEDYMPELEERVAALETEQARIKSVLAWRYEMQQQAAGNPPSAAAIRKLADRAETLFRR